MSMPAIAARCVLLGTLFASAALCQQHSIVIKAVNGKTGKPIANVHLLIWKGKSEQDVVEKVERANDAHTGADGTAILEIDPDTGWLQVWVDGFRLCQDDPNSHAFNIGRVSQTGGNSSSNCGVPVKNTPGTFVVFAREPTLREKMAW